VTTVRLNIVANRLMAALRESHPPILPLAQ